MNVTLGLLLLASTGLQPEGVASEVQYDAQRGIQIARGSLVIDAGLLEVVAVLHAIERQCEWAPQCKTIRLIRHTGESASLIYLRNESPWPVEDRDAVLETRIRISPSGTEALAEFRAVQISSHPP